MKYIAFTLLLAGTVGFAAAANADEQDSAKLAEDAADRGTPPWTDDSANINLLQSRPAVNEGTADGKATQVYSSEGFTIRPEWKKTFADPDHFSATSGEELFQTLCQACHMEDGQGAHGAGDYPSFAGNERLGAPGYPINIVLNGFHGMPPFGDKLNNEQIAGVVNYLRTHFGNQFDGDTTADDVANIRHK